MATTVKISTDFTGELEGIWREFQKTRNPHLLDLLIVAYLPLVQKGAARIAAKLPGSVDVEDLVQEGVLGLRRAIELFDPQRGVLFTTFVVFHIRGAILDGLRGVEWTPRLVLARSKAVEEATRRFEMSRGRKPTEDELAEALRTLGKNVKGVLKDARRVKQTSLSTMVANSRDGATVSIGDILPACATPNVTLEAQRRELRDLITQGLTRGERLILILHYYENMTMKEIGATLDLSESRISQMHKSVVLRLKAKMAGHEQWLRAVA